MVFSTSAKELDQVHSLLIEALGLSSLTLHCGAGLPEHIARRIFAEVVAAVAHCHAHGVCHLDIKPDVCPLSLICLFMRLIGRGACSQNVMFIEGRTVLTDFGNGQVFDASLPPSLAITRFANEPRCVTSSFVRFRPDRVSSGWCV